MIDPNNINSGADYAQLVIEGILEIERTLPMDQQMSIELITYLTKLIEEQADEYYTAYVIGKRETFMFSDVDLNKLFNKAGELYVGDLLDGLVDKDMVEVSVGKNGEILYSATKKGIKAAGVKQPKKQGHKPKK